jgi:uncharacterized phiE125 gp8 family phage protein
MPRHLALTTPPPFLPVTVEDAKNHLRIDTDDEDSIIRGFIEAATEWVENATDRQLITASYAFSFAEVPDEELELPKSPLVSVDSVTYIDADDEEQTLDPSAYRVTTNTTPGEIVFIDSPDSLADRTDAITVNYTAGYGDPEDVPYLLQMAILQLVGTWYSNREGVTDQQLREIPFGIERLIGQYRVGGVRWIGSRT